VLFLPIHSNKEKKVIKMADEDGGFSYPGYDSSGDDRSAASSVDASVDEEMDRRPWRSAGAGGGGATAGDSNTYDEEDASTLDDQNGPWIYAEPRDNEDGEYSLAGTAVSSLGVTSYARYEEQSVMSRQLQQQQEGSYDQPPSDQALNSADATPVGSSDTSRWHHHTTSSSTPNHPIDDPSVGSSQTNSFFRGITRRVSEIMSTDGSEPAAPASAAYGAKEPKEAEYEQEGDEDVVNDEEEEEEGQVPSPSTSTHSLNSRSSADILKSELDDAINQWESTAKLDVDGPQENKYESQYPTSNNEELNRGTIPNLSGMLAERSSTRLKKASATASKRRAGAATSTTTSSGSGSLPASRSISPPTHSNPEGDAEHYEDFTVPSSSTSNINTAAKVSATEASATHAPSHDSFSTTNTADLIGDDANNVLLAAGAPSAATFISAARSAAHTDLNENIKERQRDIELDNRNSVLHEEGMGTKKQVSFHTAVSMSTGSGDASSKMLLHAESVHHEPHQPQPQEQGDSARFSYSEDMKDDDVLTKAKAGAQRAASSRNVQVGAVAIGPDGGEAFTTRNLSDYQQQYLNKQQQFISNVESSGHVTHAASANRNGKPPSLAESSRTVDYASSAQSSVTPGAHRTETNTDSRIHSKISSSEGPTTAEDGYDEPNADSRMNKKIAANGGLTAPMVADFGRSEDGPLDRAVNRSVNRSVRKKMAAMGINDMNAEIGVEEDDEYYPQGNQGDESFAFRKSRAGRMSSVSGPGAHHLGGASGKYGPQSGGKLTAEMGIEDDEEEGNGNYGRPGLDQMGPLMDASSRWVDGGADHLRKNSPPAAICGFRRTAVLTAILVAVTIGMIALYVPMGPAHILPFGHDGGGRTVSGPSDSTATTENSPSAASSDKENEGGVNVAGEPNAPGEKPGGVVDMANVPGSPGSGPIPGKPIIPGSPINTANGPQLTAGGPQLPTAPTVTRAEAIRQIVEDLSDADLLDDASSPQSRALRWITYDDEAALDETNPPRIKQRYILAVLYFATNGDSWTNKYSWLSKAHECDWNGVGYDRINDADAEQGVFCSDQKVAVEIFIISNNMSGNLPEELGGLYQVYSLSFWTNDITGAIPVSLGKLSILNVLGKFE